MRVVPRTRVEQIEFFENRIDGWRSVADEIGLTEQQVDELEALADQARADYALANRLRTQSVSATNAMRNSVDRMHRFGSAMISAIKAKAETSDNPHVYTAAKIMPPASPSSSGLPDRPTGVSAQIDNSGHVVVSWNGSLAHGTFFSVMKKRSDESHWQQLGAVRGKVFIDPNSPPSCEFAMYQVFAHRSSGSSAGSEPISVFFTGQSPGGYSEEQAA